MFILLDKKNGTYAGSYVPTKSGKYQLAGKFVSFIVLLGFELVFGVVACDGGAIAGSPFSVLVIILSLFLVLKLSNFESIEIG